MVSKSIQSIIPSIKKSFPFLQKHKFPWIPFANFKMKSLQFLTKNWLAVEVSKVGQGYTKRYVYSRCVVRVFDNQGEAIGKLQKTIQNITKHINIMSTTMGGMGQDLHNMGKEMEYYAAKLHQVEKRVEVSDMFSLWHF